MEKRQRRIQKGNIVMTVIATVIIFMSVCISFDRMKAMDIRSFDNEVRILTTTHIAKVEQGVYEAWDYPFLIFDLEGTVLYADDTFQRETGSHVNVQEELGIDECFGKKYEGMVKKSFVLQKENVVTGFVVYYIPEKVLLGKSYSQKMMYCMIPIVFGVLLGVLLLVLRLLYCNFFVLKPIGEIATSSRQIIRGNYEYEFRRIFSHKVNADEVGELTYSFELMRDELKAKQLREEKLKKSQQELISCVSHDLKTPISTIKAYAEGIRDGIAKDEKARHAYISVIIEKTDLLIGMINDLLNISNAQLNQLDIFPKEIYFVPFFEKAMEEIGGYVRQQGLEFHYTISLDERLVCIDEKRILEVLYNLAENSMKYRREEDAKIEIIATREQNDVLIRVIDNGVGISSDDIPYVFDKFYRAEKSRTSSIPGSGLGLSICKYIVEKHGGSIYCKSRKEKGCEIGFTLK